LRSSREQATAKKVSLATVKRRAALALREEGQEDQPDEDKQHQPIFEREKNSRFFKDTREDKSYGFE